MDRFGNAGGPDPREKLPGWSRAVSPHPLGMAKATAHPNQNWFRFEQLIGRNAKLSPRGRACRALAIAQGLVCFLCDGKFRNGDRINTEHVLPRSLGGRNIRENLRAVHRECNTARGVMPIEQWRARRGFASRPEERDA